MGTSNFHTANANSTYVIDPQDEFEYNDILENLIEDFKNVEKTGAFDFNEDDDIKLNTELRSFPARSIGIVYQDFDFLGLNFEVHIIPVVRDGYYEAGNLDYEFAFYHDAFSEPFEDIDEIVEDVELYCEDYDINPGLVKIHIKSLENRLNLLKDFLTEEVENIFKRNSNEYQVSAQFSNGETWYERVA